MSMALAKNHSRGGRPKNENVERYPSGRAKPEEVGPTREALARRIDLLGALIARYPERFAKPLAADPDAAWHIGRLYLIGMITRRQKDAADAYRKAAAAYEALLGAPTHPRALDMNRVAGQSTIDEVVETKRFKRAKRRYERLHHALLDAGHDTARCVVRALRGEDVDIDRLKLALNVLDGA